MVSTHDDGSTGYGIGIWVLATGLIIAILSGLYMLQFDSLQLAVSSQAQRRHHISQLVFYGGVGVTAVGLLTAMAEQTWDYLAD